MSVELSPQQNVIDDAPAQRKGLTWVLLGGAILGTIGGLFFGNEAFAAANHVWQNWLLPAFLEVQLSGLPFCG